MVTVTFFEKRQSPSRVSLTSLYNGMERAEREDGYLTRTWRPDENGHRTIFLRGREPRGRGLEATACRPRNP